MKPLSGGSLCLPEPEQEKLGKDPMVVGSLRFIKANKNITLAIPGVENVREVEENASVGSMPEMTSDELAELHDSIGV